MLMTVLVVLKKLVLIKAIQRLLLILMVTFMVKVWVKFYQKNLII
jgi:hypothetical protein